MRYASAPNTNDFAVSAGHWYRLDGTPAYTIVGASGSERAVTLSDARKHNLVPSVTTIIRCASAPALEKWKAEQLLMAGLTLPRLADEAESAWLERVRDDAKEQTRRAAERGERIHGALERYFRGEVPDDDYWEHVKGVHKIVRDYCDDQTWLAERSFAHPAGYGGKCDLHSAEWVIDYKSKEFDGPDKWPRLYDDHFLQLAAYRRGLCVPNARCAIVFVSSTKPGLAAFCQVKEDDLRRGLAMFDALLAYWQCKTGYRPMTAKEAA